MMKKNKQTNTQRKICFCFGTHGVRYFMNLEPEENRNSKQKQSKNDGSFLTRRNKKIEKSKRIKMKTNGNQIIINH